MLRILSLLIFVAGALVPTNAEGSADKKLYKIHEDIIKAGYPAETYDVTTEDGYILELIRIPHGKDGDDGVKRPVVFMMHGLSDFGGTFIALGPNNSLAYNLVDRGADVWLGNTRGVANSRRHLKLDPDNEQDKYDFFDFTWHEIGTIDLPLMIDFVLEHTGEEKLHYVGHSQGGTVFFVLNSEKPEYNDKFINAHLLAGVGYQKHFPNGVLRAAALSVDLIYKFARGLGLVELIGPNWGKQVQELQSLYICSTSECGASRSSLDEVIKDLMNPDRVLPGAALKQYAHYGQNIRDKKFRQWNYGVGNLAKYGSLSPPEYDLTKVTAEIVLHYSEGDILLGVQDVQAMAEDLPNARLRKVPRKDFTHTDFLSAEDSKEHVVDYIVEEFTALVH